MRNQRLTFIALALSLLSVGYAGWLHYRMQTALQDREHELVRQWTPQMRSLYADMMGRTNVLPADPQTFDQLLSPLIKLVNQVGNGEETDLPTAKKAK